MLRGSLRNTGGEWREVELSISTESPSTPGASTVEGWVRGPRHEKRVQFGLGNRRLATRAGLYDLAAASLFLGLARGAGGLVVHNGGPHAAGKQFFVLTQSDELVLVREENWGGRLRPNRGFDAGRQAGRWRAWTPTQVSRALESEDPAEVLEVLLALASGEFKQALSPASRARLSELARSPEPWVAEPAKLALGS